MARKVIPELDALLLHPVRPKDNDPEATGGNYSGWKLDHAGMAQFYVVGFNWLREITGRIEANYYHSFGAAAFEKAHGLGWAKELKTDFRSPISYNQFRNALILHRPMFFGHAAQILLSFELALADAIKRSLYAGNATDVYENVKILPACYNVDRFNRDTVAHLRNSVDGFDREILTASGQTDPTLIEQLAKGNCVTRRTARAIRSKTLELAGVIGVPLIVGDVRGSPGRERLGRKSASLAESVEFNDPARYVDASGHYRSA
jgi:hypothetical protein